MFRRFKNWLDYKRVLFDVKFMSVSSFVEKYPIYNPEIHLDIKEL